jgi:hypothetical protein
MLSPVPWATRQSASSPKRPALEVVTGPATSPSASTSARNPESSPTSADSSTEGTYALEMGNHHPVPEASPRSPTDRPLSTSVMNSWGRRIARVAETISGSTSRSRAQWETVKEVAGTDPT